MNLLFDLDGTLTDPFPGITKCISYALEKMGITAPTPESLGWCIGPPLKESFSRLLNTDNEKLTDKAVSIYRERFNSTGIFENKVYENIPEVLAKLQGSGHALFVATSKPEIFARRIIEHFDLKKYFNNIYGSELDGTRVDKTGLISYILKNEKLFPADTIMIGDREYDILGAKENNLQSIGVLWGYGTKDELKKSGAGHYVKHPGDLISVINSNLNPEEI